MSSQKSFTSMPSRSVGASKLRYRLLADGTILDQEKGTTAGYIVSRSRIDECWSLGGHAKQKYIRDYLESL